jgi:gliding motility-associated-like protein
MNKRILFFLIFFMSTIFWSDAYGQFMTFNGTTMNDSGGGPSNCTAGNYKPVSSTVSGNCVTFTTNSFQNGAIWACSTVDLNQSFKVNFNANFGNNTATGDGIAFLLQREGAPQVIGGAAGGIGYAQGNGSSCQGAAGGCPITPSVAVEFDTWDNTSDGLNDIVANHIAIHRNGEMNVANTLAGPISAINSVNNIRDGLDHAVCITWDPAINRMQIFFDGNLRLTYNGNIRDVFGSGANTVWWGFTSGSGGSAQTQRVCSVQMQTNIASPSCLCTAPVATATPNPQTICSGNATGVSLTSSITGTTFSWVATANANVTGESTTNQTGASITDVLVNTTATAQIVTYTVTPTAAGCVGTAITVPVTVNPVATINTMTVTVCTGNLFTVTPVNVTNGVVPAGTTYSWSAPVVTGGMTGGASGTNQTSISGTLTNPTNTPQTATYTVTPTSGTCVGATFTLTVTVNPAPAITAMTNATCSGVAFTSTPVNVTNGVVPAGTTYSWSAPVVTGGMTGGASGTNQTSISGTLTNPTSTPQTATYTVTPTSGTCVGATFTVTVTVNPSPAITAMTNTTCSGVAFTSTPVNVSNGVVPAGTTYSWSAPVVTGGMTGGASGTNQTSISGTLTNPTNTPQTATYTVTPTSGTCVGATFTLTVTVNPAPAITAMTNATCSGVAFTSTPVNVTNGVVPAGTTYSWSAPVVTGGMTGGASGTNQTSISGTLTNPTSTPQTATYTVTPTSGTCVGATFTVTVTVNPSPAITAMTNTTCSGVAFTSTPVNVSNGVVPAGTTYSWSAPVVTGGMTGGASGTNQTSISGTLTNPTNTPQTATYTVTPTSGTCVGATFTLTVTVNPAPAITAMTNTTCSGVAFTSTPVNVSNGVVPTGTTYSWSAPVVTGGMTGGASGTNQTSISGTLTNPTNTPQTATYTVTPTSGTCVGATFTVTVTVNPSPAITAMTNTTCSGVAFTSTPVNVSNGVVPAGTTYSWSAPVVTGGMTGGASGTNQTSISGTLTNPTSTPQTATYTITPTSGSCSGATFTLTVTVNPIPAAPTASVTVQPTCTTPTGTIVVTAPTGASIQYSIGGAYQSSGTFSGLAPGSYNVTSQDTATGCISSATVLVVNPLAGAPVAPTASVTVQPTCTTPTGTIVVTAPTGASIQYSIGGAYQSSGTFSGLAPGSYNVTAQDTFTGCISSATVLVVNPIPANPDAPTASVTVQPTCTTPTGTIVVTAPTGASIQYSIGGAYQSSGTFAGLAAGSYNVTAQDTATGCISSATVLVVNPIPANPAAPTASVTVQPTCTTPTGTIVVTAPTGASIQYSIGGAYQSSGTFSGLAPGSYNVTAQDTATGCISSATVLVVNPIPANPAAPTASVTVQPTCTTPTGTIVVTAPTGASIQYSIGGAYQSSGTFAGLAPGSYNVTAQDTATGCISSATVLVVNPLAGAPVAPTASVTVQPTCTTPTGTITITSPLNSLIPSNLFISEITDEDVGALTYIELFNGTGVSVNLSDYKIKVYNNGNAFTSCDITTMSGTLANNSTYVVSIGSVTNQGGVIPNLTVASCAGINTNDNIRLTSSTDVEIDLWGRTDGVDFTPSNSAGYTYRRLSTAVKPSMTWDPNEWTALDPQDYTNVGSYSNAALNYEYSVDGVVYQSNPVFIGLAPGSYNVTIRDISTGCISSATVLVVNPIPANPAAPTASVTVQPTCTTPTGTIVVTAPTGASIQYSIGGAYQSSGTFSGLAPGSYNVTAQDTATGCISSATVLVVNPIPANPAAPTASVTVQPTCTTPTGTIVVTAPTGASIQYSIGGAYQSSGTFSGLAPGSYNVTAQDTATGCISSATVLVVNPLAGAPVAPTASVTVQPTCTIPTGTIVVTAPTGASIQYSIGGAYQSSGTFAGLAAGSYNVTAQDTATGCISSATVLVVNPIPANPDAPTASVTVQPTCTTPTGTIVVTAPTGASIQYSIGGAYQSSGTFAGLAAGSYNVTAQDTATGCISSATVLVVNPIPANPDAPTASVTVQPTCTTPTGTIVVTAPTGASIQYSIGGAYQSSGTFAGLAAGSYNVTAQDTATGCISSATVLVVNPIPTGPSIATVAVTQPSCAVPTATILVISPIGANLEYSINNGVSYQTSTSFSGLAPSLSYTIIVRDVVSGCISSPSSNIIVDAVPASPIVTLSSGCNGSSYEIVASTTSSSATYQWYSGSTLIGSTSTVVISNTGTYQVDVTVDGCTTTEFVTIDNVTCSIPKGISPNGDGLNDSWDISGLNARKVQIFNRYGVEVYSRPNYTNEFEGKTNNGNELPTGTYYYVITLDNGAKTGWLYINR